MKWNDNNTNYEMVTHDDILHRSVKISSLSDVKKEPFGSFLLFLYAFSLKLQAFGKGTCNNVTLLFWSQ